MAAPRHKYQVFISSTFSDLAEERKAVTWAVLKARHIPAGMENFPSTDDRGWLTIQKTIDDSDYYVLLLAGRYGTIDPSTGISWTEREYNYALERKVPVLSFVRDRANTPGNMVDTDEKAKKLDSFIARVRDTHMGSSWKNQDDLATQVVQSLQLAIQDAEDREDARPGWTRGELGGPGVAVEIARLSRENAELRARLAAVSADEKKPKLEIFLNDGPIQPEWRPELYTYVPERGRADHVDLMRFGTSHIDFAALASRTLWVRLGVRNSGLAPARSVRVVVSLQSPVGELGKTIVHRFERSFPFSPSAEAGGKWRFDPSEAIYVSRHNVGTCEQRIKTIGVNQREDLIRFGFVLPEEALHSMAARTLKLTVEAWSEDGADAKAEVLIRAVVGSEVVLTEEVMDDL